MGRKIIGKKRPNQGKGKKVALRQSNSTLAWDWHLEFIQLLGPLPESNTVCGLTFFLHLLSLMFVTYDNVTDW